MNEPIEIRLHEAQDKFLKSKATYKGFAAGIGSGKSWIGCYNLLRNAKPDRLYMVIAPTFTMLSDSVFRQFVDLARQLGILGETKVSAPPSVKLLTGAEILFRSGDNPEALRGPNLSGVWMDEASLMPIEVYNILIGRLRQNNEQGWMACTFTPKGKNWCYDVFATGRPDTELFHCRTADNPFLPAGFEQSVSKQYTSRLRQQELEGLFLDSGGTLFRREWFEVVDVCPPLSSCVRAWDMASTTVTVANHDPDFTSGTLMGRTPQGMFYILDVRHARGSSAQIEQLILRTASQDGTSIPIWQEEEPGSSGKIVTAYYRKLLAGYNYRSQKSSGSKVDRATPLACQAEAGMVKLVRGPWNTEFLDEFEIFPPDRGGQRHDDIVDSTSLAFSKIVMNAPSYAVPVLLSQPRQSPYEDPSFDNQLTCGAKGDGDEGAYAAGIVPGFREQSFGGPFYG